jgi:hypothetical protein
MAFSFDTENNHSFYGDGNGNLVIEEWADNELTELIGRVTIPFDRFELVACNCKELSTEVWKSRDQ